MAKSGNPDPFKARQAKALKRLQSVTAMDLSQARKALSIAIVEIVEKIADEPDIDSLCRLTGALSRAAAEIRAIVQGVEFEERIKAIEEKQRAQPHLYNGASA